MKILVKGSAALLSFCFVFAFSGSALAASTVNLGTSAGFAVLGGSTITNTGSTVINGDLGLSPGTSVTGFPPGMITGTKHVTDGSAAQAQTDLITAYNATAGQTVTMTVSGDLGGRTLTAGVYNSSSSLGLTGTLTLDGGGNPDAVFIFQIGSALTTASGSRINFINGAQACNVFWQVASSATLGTNSTFAGSLLVLSSVTVTTGASVNGRVLARNGAVTLDANNITVPTCSLPPPAIIPPVITVTATITPTSTTPVGLTLPPTIPAAVPGLPNTGIAPKQQSGTPWSLIISTLILTALSLLYLNKKKKTV